MEQTTISIQIDKDIEQPFEDFCREVGMSVSVAFNVFARTVLRNRRIPFDFESEPDPFYSEENMARLSKAIADVKSGRAVLTEHELIEVDDDD